MIKLIDIIQELKSEKLIYEGLITSVSPEYIEEYMSRWCDCLNKTTYRLKNNSILECRISSKIDKEDFDKIFKISNNLGWFPTNLLYFGKFKPEKEVFVLNKFQELLDSEYFPISIMFEAKYHTEIKNLPKILYHITNNKNLEKIFSIGLTPREKSKLSKHPERIYFTLTLEDCQFLKMDFQNRYKEDYTILQVDIKNLDKEIKFFQDPYFFEKGIYTYQNIPYKIIKKYEP